MRRWAGLVVGMVLVALISSCAGPNSGTFGEDVVQGLATTSPAPPVTTVPSVPVRQGPAPARAAVQPVRLAIPAIGLTARVVPAGVDGNGEFSVPPSVDEVGWYRFGAGLGEPAGSVVVGGHVDDARSGPGAFYRLGDLVAGDQVSVVGEDGTTRAFRVVAKEQVPKKGLDLTPYFSAEGSARLTLFTCGGQFDGAARSYVDNVIVTAVPSG
ncbi:class F sortase [Lentzea californiensis]|uniref:class F sortase n=1 Tax=Lentzea californiensis TaxID=438851 RepID=UPI002166214F|nr:class F sortase [Lentzea californiensis]MCR3750677.1 Sortase family protein [Lentzea californiensis]